MNNLSKVDCLCKGHAEGELWSLAVSPINPDIFATASDDCTVRVWSIKNNKIISITQLESKVRSCSFSADAMSLACGLSDGTLVVLKTQLAILTLFLIFNSLYRKNKLVSN
jgi:WD40 repeat protein